MLIGLLQRYAIDNAQFSEHPFQRAPASGKRIAVVGAGPAGLSCAHRLAMHGHEVVIFEAREKAGGLNEYGIAKYKLVDDFAQREVEFLLQIGGIEIRHGHKLGDDLSLSELHQQFDAVFRHRPGGQQTPRPAGRRGAGAARRHRLHPRTTAER